MTVLFLVGGTYCLALRDPLKNKCVINQYKVPVFDIATSILLKKEVELSANDIAGLIVSNVPDNSDNISVIGAHVDFIESKKVLRTYVSFKYKKKKFVITLDLAPKLSKNREYLVFIISRVRIGSLPVPTSFVLSLARKQYYVDDGISSINIKNSFPFSLKGFEVCINVQVICVGDNVVKLKLGYCK